jgi:hypothetical protein
MNRGSFRTIRVIQYGRRHEAKCQKKSIEKMAQKSVYFYFFGLSMESTASLMVGRAAYLIQHSFAILSYQVCLTDLLSTPEENYSKVNM